MPPPAPHPPGRIPGQIIGGNLCTLNLLQGTPWMPSVRDVVLFLEDDELSNPVEFRRDLNSLMQLPDAHTVRGLVLGRFQNASGMAREDLEAIVATIPSLAGKPIVANVDFGHTTPLITFPIGGRVELHVANATRITFPSTSVNTGTSRQIRACDLCTLCVVRPDFTHEAIGTEHGSQVALLLQLATVGPHS